MIHFMNMFVLQVNRFEMDMTNVEGISGIEIQRKAGTRGGMYSASSFN